MKDTFHEDLSALMDGELTELELRRVLKQCAEDPDQLAQWQRMHRVRSVLRGEHREPGMRLAATDLTQRVSAALASEDAHDEPIRKAAGQAPSWWRENLMKPLASVAVAASVSAMVVVGWQSVSGVPGVPAGTGLAQNNGSAAPLVSQTRTIPGTGAMPVAEFQSAAQRPVRALNSPAMDIIRLDDQAYNERLRRYLISHSANAAQHTASGTYSYARAVSLKPAPGVPATTTAAEAQR